MSVILDILKALDEQHGEQIEQWLGAQRAVAAPFFTTSTDLRHSGHRLVPVDTNLFPAGFNNLSAHARMRSSRFIAHFLTEYYPQARRIAIIPENHTRNLGYLENLATLLDLFAQLGLEVQLGSLAAEAGNPLRLQSASGRELVEQPLRRDGDRLLLESNFVPDLIIMNNDMTAGAPAILQELAQPVVPPLSMGWWQRRKSVHFAAYRALMDDFCRQFQLDPWLFCAEFHRCGMVDFKERTGIDAVARGVERVLKRVREKHREHGIEEEPYVYVKAESGTYGMGIMTVRSAEEMFELNKKERNKMQTIKEGARVSDVIIQEGVPTIDRIDGKPAEPMVYMIDGVPVGGMYRVNSQRDSFSNLNAAGMEFAGMCDEGEERCGSFHAVQDCHFRSFGIIGAIAALAAAREDYITGRDGAGI